MHRFLTSFDFVFGIFVNLHMIFNYCNASFRDPGFTSSRSYMSSRTCQKCFFPKPTGAHHCSICNKCVVQMGTICWQFRIFCFSLIIYFKLYVIIEKLIRSPLSLDKQLRGPFQPALLFQLLSLDHARLWILLAHSISLSTLGGVALAQDLQALRLSLLVVYLDHSRSRCSHWLSLHSHLKRPDNSRG